MLACSQCGNRQDTGESCSTCKHAGLCDLSNPRDVEFLRGIDRRMRDERTNRIRKISVAIAMALVGALWFVPGFWTLRQQYFALPLLADQLALIVVFGAVLIKVIEPNAPLRRFHWLDTLDELPPASSALPNK